MKTRRLVVKDILEKNGPVNIDGIDLDAIVDLHIEVTKSGYNISSLTIDTFYVWEPDGTKDKIVDKKSFMRDYPSHYNSFIKHCMSCASKLVNEINMTEGYSSAI